MNIRSVIALFFLCASSSVLADAYKCRTQSGSSYFSESPCSGGSQQEKSAGSGWTPPLSHEVNAPRSRNRGSDPAPQQMASADSCVKKIDALGLSPARLADATTGCYQGARRGVDKKSADDCVKRIESMGLGAMGVADGIVECYGGTVKNDPAPVVTDGWRPYRY